MNRGRHEGDRPDPDDGGGEAHVHADGAMGAAVKQHELDHEDQEALPITVRPVTLSPRQIIRRLGDLRIRLRQVKTPRGRERLLADYIGFSSRAR
jgi:hypothetical protein